MMQRALSARENERFAVSILCATCGQVGSATWEEVRTDVGAPTGLTNLIAVSNGFHMSDGTTRYGNPKICCDRCDTEQPA